MVFVAPYLKAATFVDHSQYHQQTNFSPDVAYATWALLCGAFRTHVEDCIFSMTRWPISFFVTLDISPNRRNFLYGWFFWLVFFGSFDPGSDCTSVTLVPNAQAKMIFIYSKFLNCIIQLLVPTLEFYAGNQFKMTLTISHLQTIHQLSIITQFHWWQCQ